MISHRCRCCCHLPERCACDAINAVQLCSGPLDGKRSRGQIVANPETESPLLTFLQAADFKALASQMHVRLNRRNLLILLNFPQG
jgi:hypothetical protein